jgi:putative ABC transport system permease protein
MTTKKPTPPQWVAKLLRAVLDKEVAESVIGDMEENFINRKKENRSFANLRYTLEGLGFLRMVRMRRSTKPVDHTNTLDMLNNYLLIAWRNLRKEKIYSVMSVAGLAIGLASALVIYSYVTFEVSYDTFNDGHEQIYRVTEEFNDDAMTVHSAMSHSPVYRILSRNMTGIKAAVRIMPKPGFVSADKETKTRETGFCFADSLFFDTFTLPAIEGNTGKALYRPFAVVITEEAAYRYFQTTDVVGKPLYFEDEQQMHTFHIAAVIKNFPPNSHFRSDFIASFSTLDQIMPWYNNWHHPPMYVYMKFLQPTNEATANERIRSVISEHQPEYVKAENRKYLAQSIASIHLNSNLDFEWQPNSRGIYVQAFIALGAFIMMISCINFINLATAQVLRRAREAGVRKVFGSRDSQLMAQFLSETFFHVVIAMIVGFGIGELTLRLLLNGIITQQLTLTEYLSWNGIAASLLFGLAVSILAGLYPSIYFARFKPATVLKRANPGGAGKDYIRKGLVTFQIIVSCLLISGTIIIYHQVSYFRNKDLGFTREEVIAINLTDRFAQTNYQTLKDNLLRESAVSGVALSSALPGHGLYNGFDMKLKGVEQEVSIKTLAVDEDFLATYQIPVVDGRDFSKDIATDQTEAFIINRAGAKMLNWDEAVGQELELTVYINGAQQRPGKVIGLVDDFHFESLHRKIEPLLLYINKHPYYAERLSIRVKPGNATQTIDMISQHWKSFHPDKPLDFSFVSENLEHAYQSEITVSKILLILTTVAIAISVLGIFALSSYMSMRRAKEMSIRKVFGASNFGILLLQAKEYVMLTLIANLIVIPLTTIGANQWLDSFAYHISLEPGVFALTIAASTVATLAIISFHVVKVGMANPVLMMRNE